MNFVINVPIYLTLFRIIMIPVFTAIFYLPICWAPTACICIFFLAAVTDWLDGYLARRWKQTTSFGKFLDPVADKMMVVTALVLISEYFHVWWVTLPTSSMIVREVVISALREWASSAAIGKFNYITVSWIGKIKTCVQMLALCVLLWRSEEWTITVAGIVALYISVILTFWSMFCYLYAIRFNLFYR